MRIEAENIVKNIGSSLSVGKYGISDLAKIRGLHWHPEFELIYISGGSGKRFINGHVSHYEQGDLVFLGPNIPHAGFKDCVLQGYFQVVVQFGNLFGEEFLENVELSPLRRLLKNAKGGIVFSDKVKKELAEPFKNLISLSNFERFFSFLHILKVLSKDEYTSLNYNQTHIIKEPRERIRFEKILSYIKTHHNGRPQLDELAQLVNMHPSSLCRFLKLNSSKTFIELVNDFRIQKSCTLLIESDLTITQIAFESGFRTLSFYNKKFNELMKMSPSQYRKLYHV